MGRLVVGYDGSTFAKDAARWAVAWAAATGMEVDLLCSVDVPDGWDRLTPELREDYRRDRFGDVEELRANHPEVSISGHFTTDAPVAALENALRRGHVCVLASRGTDGFWGRARSLSAAVLPHAGGPPVIILPPAVTELDGDRVVVGVKQDTPVAPLDYAAGAATRTGLPLHVAHVQDWLDADPPAWLAERVDGLRARYPDLTINVDILAGKPSKQLATAGVAGVLLIIGSKRPGLFAPGVLGQAGRELIAIGSCAVAVVRPAVEE